MFDQSREADSLQDRCGLDVSDDSRWTISLQAMAQKIQQELRLLGNRMFHLNQSVDHSKEDVEWMSSLRKWRLVKHLEDERALWEQTAGSNKDRCMQTADEVCMTVRLFVERAMASVLRVLLW